MQGDPFSPLTRHHLHQLKEYGGVKNKDGSISTVRTLIVNLDGDEVVIPSVWDGKILSDEEAIERAISSGINWPRFRSVKDAESRDREWHRRLGLTR